MGRRKQKIEAGDVFVIPIPTADPGTVGVGQIISEERYCLNSVLCAFFIDLLESETLVSEFSPSADRLLSVALTTRDLLDSGRWKVCKRVAALDVSVLFPIDELRAKEFVGANIHGSRVMWELISAYHRKSPWDDFYDPMYLDALLLPGIVRPDNVILTKSND